MQTGYLDRPRSAEVK